MEYSYQLLSELAAEYGNSFFILDLKRFERNFSEFLSLFQEYHHENTRFGFSYKTDYIPLLCQKAHELGAYAEVVSAMEYEIALEVGVPGSAIIFNGPSKSEASIEKALLTGSMVNLDSFEELFATQAIVAKYPDREFKVGVRFSFDIGHTIISRFGIDVTRESIKEVLAQFAKMSNCWLCGIHCHFSGDRGSESYGTRVREMTKLGQRLFENRIPDYINLGGGFCGRMSDGLKAQFSAPIPDYKEYAQVIGSALKESEWLQPEKTQIILEPGVALVGDVMNYVTNVCDIKVNRGKGFIFTNGSVHNIKPTMNRLNLPFSVYSKLESSSDARLEGLESVDIVGYTCMEHDCMIQGYQRGLSIGDYLVFENTGAYTVVFKPQFIRGAPPIIYYDRTSENWKLARRAESVDDILSTYVYT